MYVRVAPCPKIWICNVDKCDSIEGVTVTDRLPIYEALPALKQHLQLAPIVVLQAPPGAGKSTVLPLELLEEPWLRGRRILMLEPRRLAARSVATRMADVCHEDVGQTVGYRVRFEQRISASTRIEVLTEGILTRRLQHDAELDGVGLVIFDEFHERSLHADLALVLCREVQQALRTDLRILIMSATLDGDALRAVLDNAPIVTASGRQFPVSMHYAARDLDGQIAVNVADAVTRALAEQPGDVLAFLPGVSEIQRAEGILEARHADILLCLLFGEQTLEAQRDAILPDPQQRRKVVLATAIAETSLTIEGIQVVVDSGYSRVPRFDSRTGLTRLETVRVTLDSADQRAGRAGRLGPGVCYRLWSAATQQRLNPSRKPEILEADLAPLRLELAQWGVREAADVRWITPPPVGALRQATELLQTLEALKENQLTDYGHAMLALPIHPRLAHLLLKAHAQTQRHWPALAADIAALLDERDPLSRNAGADMCLRVEALRYWRATQRSLHGADVRVLARVERIATQWRRHFNTRIDNGPADPHDVGWLVSLAYPDRIAQARGANSNRYRLSNRRGVRLDESDPLSHSPWLAVAQLDGGGGGATEEGRIYLAAPLDETSVVDMAVERDVAGWDARQGMLIARRERRLGELVVSSQNVQAMPHDEKITVLCAVLRTEGLNLLNWGDANRQWQARAQSVHIWRGEDRPDVSDTA